MNQPWPRDSNETASGKPGAVQNYNIGSSRVFSRDNEEVCQNPRCGYEHAKLSDGLFDLSSEAVRVLSAPDISHTMLAAINGVAVQLLKHEIAPKEAIKRYRAINKRVGAAVKVADSIGRSAVFYISFALAVATYLLVRSQTDIARDQLRLQSEAPSAQEITESVLKTLSETIFRSQADEDKIDERSAQKPSTGPTKNEPPLKSGTTKGERQRKPKAREIRRKALREHRRAFLPRTHEP